MSRKQVKRERRIAACQREQFYELFEPWLHEFEWFHEEACIRCGQLTSLAAGADWSLDEDDALLCPSCEDAEIDQQINETRPCGSCGELVNEIEAGAGIDDELFCQRCCDTEPALLRLRTELRGHCPLCA